MKTKVTFILAALFLVSFLSFATELPGDVIQKKDTTKQIFDIRMDKNNFVVLRASTPISNKRQSFILKIHSKSGSLLYANTYSKKSDALIPFDISNLPTGKYTFDVHKGFKKVYSKEFIIDQNNESPEIVVENKK